MLAAGLELLRPRFSERDTPREVSPKAVAFGQHVVTVACDDYGAAIGLPAVRFLRIGEFGERHRQRYLPRHHDRLGRRWHEHWGWLRKLGQRDEVRPLILLRGPSVTLSRRIPEIATVGKSGSGSVLSSLQTRRCLVLVAPFPFSHTASFKRGLNLYIRPSPESCDSSRKPKIT